MDVAFEAPRQVHSLSMKWHAKESLEPFLRQEHCHKLPFVGILTIQVCDTVFIGAYIPDGRTLEGIQQWITTMDTLEARFPKKAVVALGDLNCRARTLGHSRLNESGPILDTWIQVSDNFDVHLFTESTRPASQGFLDVVIYKDLDAPPESSFKDRIPSDHRGILTRIDLKDGHNLSRESPAVRLKMRPIKKALTELVRQKGGFGPRFKGVRNTAVLRPRSTSIDASATGSSPARAWTVSKNPCFKPRKRVNKSTQRDKASPLTWKRHPSPKTRKNSTT